jgi:hypothetical protein
MIRGGLRGVKEWGWRGDVRRECVHDFGKSRADSIRCLTEEWLETGDNRILDKIDELAKQGVDLATSNTRVLERYLDATLDVHLHFFRRVQNGVEVSAIDAQEYCAVAHRVITGQKITLQVKESLDGFESPATLTPMAPRISSSPSKLPRSSLDDRAADLPDS